LRVIAGHLPKNCIPSPALSANAELSRLAFKSLPFLNEKRFLYRI